MKLSMFTDEVSPDPCRAIELAVQWGVPSLEVRGLPGGRFPASTDSELSEFHQRVVDAGLSISGVSPGFHKGTMETAALSEILSDGLPRACEWARRWGTDLVSCFAFRRDAGGIVPDAVVAQLVQMAAVAAGCECRLVLENEAGCWGDTGFEAAGIVHDVDADNLSLLWDPGNSARAGSPCPYPDEYEQLKELVTHVHLKNFIPQTESWSLLETGVVDWPGQLRALCANGYAGYIVIETHLRDLPEGVQAAPGLTPLETTSWRNREFVRAHLDL